MSRDNQTGAAQHTHQPNMRNNTAPALAKNEILKNGLPAVGLLLFLGAVFYAFMPSLAAFGRLQAETPMFGYILGGLGIAMLALLGHRLLLRGLPLLALLILSLGGLALCLLLLLNILS